MTGEAKKAFLLRVDPGLWGELQGWAAQELRSVNAQIEYILKEALARRRRTGGPPPATGKAGGSGGTSRDGDD